VSLVRTDFQPAKLAESRLSPHQGVEWNTEVSLCFPPFCTGVGEPYDFSMDDFPFFTLISCLIPPSLPPSCHPTRWCSSPSSSPPVRLSSRFLCSRFRSDHSLGSSDRLPFFIVTPPPILRTPFIEEYLPFSLPQENIAGKGDLVFFSDDVCFFLFKPLPWARQSDVRKTPRLSLLAMASS